MIERRLYEWLLDPAHPSSRYLALRDLGARPETDPEVAAARAAIVHTPPASQILDAQYPAGYWIAPGRGYSPKYKGTIWQVIALADLGAAPSAPIARACAHILQEARLRRRALFSAHVHSTGLYPCLNGDLLRALWHFQVGGAPQIAEALARWVVARNWSCPRNSAKPRDSRTWQPCVWGCVKVLRALAMGAADRVSRQGERPPAVRDAIEHGLRFLLARDLAADIAPLGVDRPSQWLRASFPSGYGSDLLEALLVLRMLGASDAQPRALRLLRERRDARGRWALDRALPNTWATFGEEGEPNRWITLRALVALGEGAQL
ncbi:MAG: hypothetical protein JXA09_01230 [Anaerolineae bacterium]|nr:hypothetical protein [Anaerolineae bacterium]